MSSCIAVSSANVIRASVRSRICGPGVAVQSTSDCSPVIQCHARREDGAGSSPLDESAVLKAVSFAAASVLVWGGAAQAGESVPAELSGLLNSWLDALQALGPLGPAAFVATIGLCECIPFFPTQPLSICAGLLFGAGSGAALNLTGLAIASTLAFTLSRTVGRGLAQAVIEAETGGSQARSKGSNPVAQKIEEAQTAIENGGPLQQFTAILLLRLTPIVPFSASNYVLGLTPVSYGPFISATVVGMAVWSALLASLGSAGRNLLTSGKDLSEVLTEVGSGAGEVTSGVFVVAGILGAAAFAVSQNPGMLGMPSADELGQPEALARSRSEERAKIRHEKELATVESKGGQSE